MPDETIRVLLVEDNPGDAFLVKEFLSEVGTTQFELVHVVRLGEALERLAQERFDVVLLDLALPDGQGLDVVTKTRDAATDTALVVLTGRADTELALEALRVGAQDYLNKMQISNDALGRAIHYALERHRLQLEMVRLQERLREADQVRVLAETAGAAAHEINNPLTVVMGIAERLLLDIAPEDPHRKDLASLYDAADQIAKIVRKMGVARKYVTKSYPGGANIINLDAAAEE